MFWTFAEFQWTPKISLAFFNVCDSPADEGEILLGVADGVGRAGVVQDARDRKQALKKNQHPYGSGSGGSVIDRPNESGLFYQRQEKMSEKSSILIFDK